MARTRRKRLDLLLKEITDPYVQENFHRLERYIRCLITEGILDPTPPAAPPTVNTTVITPVVTNPGDTVQSSVTIPAGQTLVVDEVASNSFDCLEYSVSLKYETGSGVKCLKLFAVNDDGVLEEQVFAIAGRDLNVFQTTQISSGVYQLAFTNNEASSVVVTYLRSQL